MKFLSRPTYKFNWITKYNTQKKKRKDEKIYVYLRKVHILHSGEPFGAFVLGQQVLAQGLALLGGDTGGQDLGVVLETQMGQLLGPIAVFEDPAGAYKIDGVGPTVGPLGDLFSQHGHRPNIQFHLQNARPCPRNLQLRHRNHRKTGFLDDCD